MLDSDNPIQKTLIKAVHRSQHCQRNWDLEKTIPEEDLEVLVTAATQCPSKQNVAFYRAHFITNRDIIEQIHETTKFFTLSFSPYRATTNSQTLANLLIVLEENNFLENAQQDTVYRNDEIGEFFTTGKLSDLHARLLRRDRDMAVGVSAGYLNLTATLMGYSTGCCACFDDLAVRKILGLQNEVVLLMGIGFKNPNLNRRFHHKNHNFKFPTKSKQKIPVSWIK